MLVIGLWLAHNVNKKHDYCFLIKPQPQKKEAKKCFLEVPL